MPYVDRTYWVVDSNGKRHLTTITKMENPTEEEARRKRIMDKFLKDKASVLERFAQEKREPFPSERHLFD